MADNTTLPGTGDVIASDDIAGVKHQRVKVEFGVDGVATDVSAANPMPVTLPAGKNNVTIADTQADIHGQLVGVTRLTQITTKFFQQAPSSFLNVTASGGATAAGPTAGTAVFSTGTATTAALLAQTPVGILYAAQYEAWAVLSGSYTAPTSAASFQRLGIYDSANGYSFGFNGLIFGLWVRVNSVDTFIAQTSWNRDVLSGVATSLFTSGSSAVAFVPTNLNMYRIRYGWYGGVSALFEVYAPDGNWVVVHQVRTVNAQVAVNMTVPDLPMSVEISKTASDATNLSISCGGWAAGITSPSSGPSLSGQKPIAALNATVNVPLSGIGELSFAISGTWVGTLAFQYSLDGLNWTVDAPLNNVSGVFSTSTTVNGVFTAAVASSRFYRLVATAWTSGSASVIYSGSTSANFVVSQSLITDGGNNGPVAVKPASTAAVVGDAALVVALHPASPLPPGANIVGAVNVNTAIASTVTVMQNAAAVTGNGTSLPATGYGTAVLQISGTFVASIAFEASVDAGATWFAISATQVGQGDIFNTATVPGLYRMTVAGLDLIRARVTWVSGTSITVTGRTSNAVNASKIVKLATSGLTIGNVLMTGVTAVTTLSTANTAVTLTLPAPAAGQFHYLTSIKITLHNTSAAAVVGSAVALAFTSTNLPGALAWTDGNALAAGTSKTVADEQIANAIKASAAGTATTITAPIAGAGVQSRITAYYYTGV